MVNLDDLTYWQKKVYHVYEATFKDTRNDWDDGYAQDLKRYVQIFFSTDKIAKQTCYEILHGKRISAIQPPKEITGLGKVHRLMSSTTIDGKPATVTYDMDGNPSNIYIKDRRRKSSIKKIKRRCKCRR